MLIAQKCTGHAEQEYQQTMQDYKVLNRRFHNKKTTHMRVEKLACVGIPLLNNFSENVCRRWFDMRNSVKKESCA